jgi:hypothetical protein
VGVINVNESYDNAYGKAFKAVAEANSMTVAVYSFNFNFTAEEIQGAVCGLASTGYRYFFGIIFGPEHYDIVMTEAFKQGIAGHLDPAKSTSWIFTGGVQRYVQDVQYPAGSPLALATAGTSMIQADGGQKGMPEYDRFMKVDILEMSKPVGWDTMTTLDIIIATDISVNFGLGYHSWVVATADEDILIQGGGPDDDDLFLIQS